MQLALDNYFTDLDLMLAQVKDWDIDFRLMQNGSFSGRLRQVALPNLLISYGRFNSGINQLGATPPGFRTLVVQSRNCHGYWWRGHNVTNKDVLIFPRNNELSSVSSSDFEVFTVSLREDYLEALCESLKTSCSGLEAEVCRIADT